MPFPHWMECDSTGFRDWLVLRTEIKEMKESEGTVAGAHQVPGVLARSLDKFYQTKT